MEYNEEGLLRLRNAIVEKAAKDYLYERKYELSHKDGGSIFHKSEIESLRKWFLGAGFESMGLKIEGSFLLHKLDEIADTSRQVRSRVTPEKPRRNMTDAEIMAIIDDYKERNGRG